jgi:hypothetical protein
MLPAYSVQIFKGDVGIGPTLLYEATDQFRSIILDVELYNGSGTDGTLSLSLYEAGSFGAAIVVVPTFAGGTTFHWDGRVVLESGDQLYANAPAAGFTAIVSGYELTP